MTAPGTPPAKETLLARLTRGEQLSFGQQLKMLLFLSVPAVLAQISSTVMQYIDAAMVGQLGAGDSASIGLVASSTWLFYGLAMAAGVGFSVQTAQKIGAGSFGEARNIVGQGLRLTFVFSIVTGALGAVLSPFLPEILGGNPEINLNAAWYFLFFALFFPAVQLNVAATGMIQSSGNMAFPSFLHIVMCVLDVVFNAVLIFPGRDLELPWGPLHLPGAGLGVAGAALGTGLAELVIAGILLFYLLRKSPVLKKHPEERTRFRSGNLRSAVRIAVPVALEQMLMSGAYISFTVIVAPLGTVALAANSFAITAESLCYMPGYGIAVAATAIIGQVAGAGLFDTARRLGRMCVAMGMLVMAVMGALLYILAPVIIGVMSPDPEIRELGTRVLRIEAFAEPMFAVAIVANGVFRGVGDTLIPSIFSFGSIWLVRLPLAALLSGGFGLPGVWFAMAFELCVRGVLFLRRLLGDRWIRKFREQASPGGKIAEEAAEEVAEKASDSVSESIPDPPPENVPS